MLHLKSEDKAIAVFLCGEKDSGKSIYAEKVLSKLQDELKANRWKHVKIEIPETERAQGLLVSDFDIVPGLRSQILKQLRRENNEQPIENDGDWSKKLSATLTVPTKVFIYIDNVQSAEILKKLLPMRIARGNQIRVLLTIRDKNVLSALEDSDFIPRLHVMKTLSYNKALEFFRDKLGEELCSDKPVVRKIIKICKGYKKRMRIVREYLRKYYTDDEAFKRLSDWIKINDPDFNQLWEYLNCEEKFLQQSVIAKNAILDICSFFNGWDWHETACIFDDYVMEKLKELQLINRVSNKVSVPPSVIMYCLSRSKGIRITNATDLHDVIAEKKFRAIQGIWLLQNNFPFHISSSQLDEMTELRILALGDWTVVKGECKTKFRHLRYFQVGRVKRLPFYINQADNLRFLDNNSQDHFGTSSKEVPPTLRMVRSKGMQLKHYLDLKNLPEACELTDFHGRRNRMMILPKKVCEIYALQQMFLNECKNLKKLPKCFCKLKCLKILNLSHCEALTDLSPNFGWLSSLEKVSFSYCRQLKDLPDSMGLLSSVKEIDFSYCESIEKLPKSFVKLSTLRVLKLRGCSHLLELPERFEGLALKKLCLESCKRLKALHQRVGEEVLSQKKVSLSWCLSVEELSKGFINLIKAQVEELILVDCMSLQELPEEFCTELSRLKVLNLSGCESLLRLPGRLYKLQYLEKLNLRSCEKLEESSIKLSRLPSLKEVNLSNCHGLEGSCLGSLSKIQSLMYLDIHDSPKLVDRWNQLNRDKKNCHLVVTTAHPGLGSRSFSESLESDSSIVKELRRGIYEFFNGKWFFVDLNGRQFYPSTLEEGTTLAVIFDHNYQKQELQAVGKILDGLEDTCKKLQVVHIGMTCVSELAREMGGRHRVCSCNNYGAQGFFEKALCRVEGFDESIDYAMIISDVKYRKNHRAFSEWTSITNESVRLRAITMEVSKTEYLRLKELIESPASHGQRRNIELLRPLLSTKKKQFLITNTKQMEIKEVEGKFVFLLLSWLHNMKIECSDFKSVYERLKAKLNENQNPKVADFEVVWIPIVIQGRVTRAVHAKWVEKIGWPSIADPWSIDPIVMHYFRRHTSFNKLPLLIAVSPSGILHSDNLIPNTDKKEAEIRAKKLKEAEDNSKVIEEEVKRKLRKAEIEEKRVTEVNIEEKRVTELIKAKVAEEIERKVREKKMTEMIEHLYLSMTKVIEEEVKRKVMKAEIKEKRVAELIRVEVACKVIEELERMVGEMQIREEVARKIIEEVERMVIEVEVKEEVETKVREAEVDIKNMKIIETVEHLYHFMMEENSSASKRKM